MPPYMVSFRYFFLISLDNTMNHGLREISCIDKRFLFHHITYNVAPPQRDLKKAEYFLIAKSYLEQFRYLEEDLS